MKITVVCVGKLKEKFFADGVEEYKKNMFALLGKPGYEDLKEKLENLLKN